MENWNAEGFILLARPHGESAMVVQAFTREHGRHAGLVQGGQSRRIFPSLEIGNQASFIWSARLADNLGYYKVELVQARAVLCLNDPLRLNALQAFCGLLVILSAEREPMPDVYDAGVAWLDMLQGSHWLATLVRFELGLLAALGYGLDLNACAATGQKKDLIYVSPKSGRAVNADAGAPYKERLLQLPAFLRDSSQDAKPEDCIKGLKLTGYFLEKYLFATMNRPLPDTRRLLSNKISLLGKS